MKVRIVSKNKSNPCKALLRMKRAETASRKASESMNTSSTSSGLSRPPLGVAEDSTISSNSNNDHFDEKEFPPLPTTLCTGDPPKKAKTPTQRRKAKVSSRRNIMNKAKKNNKKHRSSTVNEFSSNFNRTINQWKTFRCKDCHDRQKTHLSQSWSLGMKSRYENDKTICPVEVFERIKRAVKLCLSSESKRPIDTIKSETETHLQFCVHTCNKRAKVELFVGLIPLYSDQCPAVPQGKTNLVKLLVSARGGLLSETEIWALGFKDVIAVVEKTIEEISPEYALSRKVICPFCLTDSPHPRDTVCDWDWVESESKEYKTCDVGHRVSSALLYGYSCKSQEGTEKKRTEKMEEENVAKAIVFIGLWDQDGNTIQALGTGFIGDKRKGLIVTAAHLFYELEGGKVMQKKKSLGRHCEIVIIASEFQYTATILPHSLVSCDACILQIKDKIIKKISMMGTGIVEKVNTIPLTEDDIRKQNLPSLDIEKTKTTQKIRIFGYKQEKPEFPNRRDIDISEATITHTRQLVIEHNKACEKTSPYCNPSSAIYSFSGSVETNGKSGGPCVNENNKVVGILSSGNKKGHSVLSSATDLRKLLRPEGHVCQYHLDRCLNASKNPGTKLNFSGLGNNQNEVRSILKKTWMFTKLQELDLTRTCFSKIPLEAVTEIESLKTLRVSHCGLTELPERWHLPNLLELYLEGNKLTNLPSLSTILKGSQNLRRLNLKNNELLEFPAEKLVSGDSFHQLEYLDLSHNQLKTFPIGLEIFTSLHTLVLSDNCLQTVPREICLITKLTSIDVTSNPINSPPMKICVEGIPQRIMRYWKYHKDLWAEKATLEESHADLNVLTTAMVDNGDNGDHSQKWNESSSRNPSKHHQSFGSSTSSSVDCRKENHLPKSQRREKQRSSGKRFKNDYGGMICSDDFDLCLVTGLGKCG